MRPIPYIFYLTAQPLPEQHTTYNTQDMIYADLNFTIRVTNTWNSLLNFVVLTPSLKSF